MLKQSWRNMDSKKGVLAPLLASHKDRVRPLLDEIDNLRSLGLEKEGIPLPTIVVIGDQSSGKSSVLQSLAGIAIPSGTGMVTRVPMEMRLKRKDVSKILLEYNIPFNGLIQREVQEYEIGNLISEATEKIAGRSKKVANEPIILTIEGPTIPDLTLIDLPGITRVPIWDQPKDIYLQIKNIILKYIGPKESIILNVLSAEVDFSTCESILLSQAVDPAGERTLAVITKADRAPEELHEKISKNSVNIGLGYVVVRNRLSSDKSSYEAILKEEEFFKSHIQFSILDKSILGTKSLARKLTKIQSEIIEKWIPNIERKIQRRLEENQNELINLPRLAADKNEAVVLFYRIEQERKEIMNEIMNGINDRFNSDTSMYYATRLDDVFSEFFEKAHSIASPFLKENFQKICSEYIDQSKGVSLPNFVPHHVIFRLICAEIDKIQPFMDDLVQKSCFTVQKIAFKVADECTDCYSRLNQKYKEVIATEIKNAQESWHDYVVVMLEKEKRMMFTKNPYYMDVVKKIRAKHMEASTSSNKAIELNDIGKVYTNELNANKDQAVVDMQINIFAYWQIVLKRLGDVIPMHGRYVLENALIKGVSENISKVAFSDKILDDVMKEQAHVQQKRILIEKNINLLNKSLDGLRYSLLACNM